KGRNYTPADFQKACELMAGASLEQFFSSYVRGRADLEPAYDEILSGAGLQLEQGGVAIGATNRPVAMKAFLGADLSQNGERLLISSVRAGTPAYEQGLNANDQIVALDGARVTKESFEARLAEKRPGDTVRVPGFGCDVLLRLVILFGSKPEVPLRISQVSEWCTE